MSDGSRLEELRRRVLKDPASILFAQLAEEYRRAGEYQRAVAVCRAGLAVHPGYPSARVTLGRALAGLGHFEAAQRELEAVLETAAENLAAIKGLAEIHRERGDAAEALRRYQAALRLAPHDAELRLVVHALEQRPMRSPSSGAAAGEPAVSGDPMYARSSRGSGRARALRTIAQLERWLAALHGTRAFRRT